MSPGFAARGWSGPHPLLAPAQAHALGDLALRYLSQVSDPSAWLGSGRAPDFRQRPWFKSLHAHVPAFHDLACHPALVAAATAELGPDVICWGLSAMRKAPGDRHPWHIDVEHRDWRGVSMFVGLSGTVPGKSGLSFIARSYRLGRPPPGLDDAGALAAARAFDPACTLDTPPVGDGEYLLFDGPVWHASHNTGDRARIAAIVQYAPASARVRIPLTFGDPPAWHPESPPCVLVAGTDRWGVNRLVGRPG